MVGPHGVEVPKRQTIWKFTVHDYIHAVQVKGEKPVVSTSYADDRGNYRPHEFLFDNPPRREQFLTVVGMTHWAYRAWKDDLLPLIAKHPWPVVGMGKKAASVRLYDEQGREVAELRVGKEDIWENYPVYQEVYVPIHLRNRLTQGYKGEAREEVRQHIDGQELRILETLINYDRAVFEDDVEAEVKKVIAEWKKGRKKTAV